MRNPNLPWQGIEQLAKFWAGSGSLLDWFAPESWEVEISWDAAQVRARVAEIVLQSFERRFGHHLPRHSGEWLDAIGQNLHRAFSRNPMPTAHTDWAATLSEFGRYPSYEYIERRPVATFDTPLTRTLKWTARAVDRATSLVVTQFDRAPPALQTYQSLGAASGLAEVMGASEADRLPQHDLDVCRSAGGVWIAIARLADQLNALWVGTPLSQLEKLTPILPDLEYQLFEMGILGISIDALRGETSGKWITNTPLAAARSGTPCFSCSQDGLSISTYYQTLPGEEMVRSSPYRALSKVLGGGVLRPDIWIEIDAAQPTDLILECKFSLDPGYVATGITQCFAYSTEYPGCGRNRAYVTLGPERVVAGPKAWDGRYAIIPPSQLPRLIESMVRGTSAEVLKEWS